MIGRGLAVALVAASIGWPIALGAALVDHLDRSPRLASSFTYLAASRVCHQRLDRSFVTQGVKWPVCGRCAGLYLSAPIGALAALFARGRQGRRLLVGAVVAAALPTAATMVAEWIAPAMVTSVARSVAALPLGAALGYVLVRTAAAANRVH